MTKRIARIALLLLPVAFCAAQVAAPDHFRELTARLKSGDKTVDFTEFRMAFVGSPEFREPDAGLAKQAHNALDAGRYDEVLQDTARMLKEDYADAQAHFFAYKAQEKLGLKDDAARSKFIFDGLIHSIEASGDGQTKETAFVAISMSEPLLPIWRGQLAEGPFAGEMIREGGHRWIKMGGIDLKTRRPFVLYFNVDIPVSHIRKEQQQKKAIGST